MIFDLFENKAIWADLGLIGNLRFNQVEGNTNNMTLMGKALTTVFDTKPDLFKLSALHAASRAEQIVVDGKIITGNTSYDKFENILLIEGTKPEEEVQIDTKFDVEDGDYTPYDIDKISSELL